VSAKKSQPSRKTFTMILYFLKRYPSRTSMVTFCLMVSGIVEGFSIALLLPLLETTMGQGSDPQSGFGQAVRRGLGFFHLEPTIPTLLILIVAGIAIKSAIRWVAMNIAGYSVARVATDLRHDLLKSLMRARWSHFVTSPSGYYAHALGSEAKIASTAYQNMASAIACLVQLFIYIVAAMFIAWQTAALAILTAIIMMILLRRLIQTSRYAGFGQIVSMKALVGRLSDALNTFKPVKAMAGEEELQSVLEKETWLINEKLRLKVMAGESMKSLQEPIMVAVMAAGLYLAIIWLTIPLPSLMIQAFLFQRLVFQSTMLQRSFQAIATEEAAFWSLRRGIGDAEVAQEPDTSGKAGPELNVAVELQDVGFSYGEHRILDHATVKIPAGSFVLLTGPSGGGKTTLLDMLVGLLHPDEGVVKIDGVAMQDIDMQQWRRRAGYVAQEMGLLHDTVFSNVTLGDPEITRERVEIALKDAGAWGFVTEMEQGIDTLVGERGSRLSGGQRQRVALARALARQPRLLLLDEITASLDPDSEAAICKSLASLRGQMTIVAISHQTALRAMADRLLRLEQGRLEVQETTPA